MVIQTRQHLKTARHAMIAEMVMAMAILVIAMLPIGFSAEFRCQAFSGHLSAGGGDGNC